MNVTLERISEAEREVCDVAVEMVCLLDQVDHHGLVERRFWIKRVATCREKMRYKLVRLDHFRKEYSQ